MAPVPPISLRKQSASALLWSGADVFMRQGLQFVVTIILARLLSPAEFGTIALLYLFTGIAMVVIDSGFSSALVQRQDITPTDKSTAFWFSLGMGILLCALLWLAAPLIADFYSLPVLAPLTNMLAVSLLINSLGSTHHALLAKALKFEVAMKIGVVASLISGITAVVLAVFGFGIWSLAAQVLSSSIVTTSLIWALSDWRPRMEFSRASLGRLFSFGGYLMLSSLLDVVYNRIYSLLIGKVYGVHDLGIYTRADNTKQIPIDMLSRVIQRVALPILSIAANDKQRLRRGVQEALQGMMLINMPIMLGLAVTAENVVYVLFGEKWLAAVPIIQVLCFAGVFWPIHVINLEVLKAQGHSHLFFRLELIKKLFGTILLITGTFYGVMGIAWSQVASSFLGSYINTYYTGRTLDYNYIDQLKDIAPVTIAAVAMVCFVYPIGHGISSSSFITLPIQVITGTLLFTLFCTTFKVKAFFVVLHMLRPGWNDTSSNRNNP